MFQEIGRVTIICGYAEQEDYVAFFDDQDWPNPSNIFGRGTTPGLAQKELLNAPQEGEFSSAYDHYHALSDGVVTRKGY